MQVRTHSGARRGALATTGLHIGLALAAALAAATAVTIASASRSLGPKVTAVARMPLPTTTTVNRRLKGDRLDHTGLQPSSSNPGEAPEGIVPKTIPVMPPDPVGSPHEDLLERSCPPIASGASDPSRQCVANTNANGRRSVASMIR